MQPAAKEAEPDYTQPDVCKKFKEAHDVCFLKWYKEDFLSGKASNNNSGDPCEAEWKVYQSCVQSRLRALNMSSLLEEDRSQAATATRTTEPSSKQPSHK